MRLASIILLSILTFGGSAFAQDLKIGYADIQAILARMPETRTMQTQLQTYQGKLTEKLQTKQNYAQTKYQEYLDLANSGADQATLAPIEAELRKLQEEIDAESRDADQKLMTRRQDLLEPIITKLQGVIDKVAEEKNYTFIMNKVDGTGSTMILYGPEEHDMTLAIMERLNIAPQE